MIRSPRSGPEEPAVAEGTVVEVTVEIAGVVRHAVIAFGRPAPDEAVALEVAIQARALYHEVMLVARRG